MCTITPAQCLPHVHLIAEYRGEREGGFQFKNVIGDVSPIYAVHQSQRLGISLIKNHG